MNYHGLIHPFPVNRPLTDWEIGHRLEIDKPVPSAKPWYRISVIKMNSTYLECVDKFFDNRGMISAASVTFISISMVAALSFLSFPFWAWAEVETEGVIALIFTVSIFLSIAAIFWFKVFKYEFNCFTHYPIRFNRKNRMVYVTRLDGTVMAESWDRLFFVLADLEQEQKGFYDIRGHRLAEDGKTVLESFALPLYGHINDENMFSLWEFIRRYMQEGPQAFMDDIEVVMDVSDRREAFWDGFARLGTDIGNDFLRLLLFPVNLWYALGRWIAMHTSKIPVWPPEVEAECQIDPDDPYIRDRDNLARS